MREGNRASALDRPQFDRIEDSDGWQHAGPDEGDRRDRAKDQRAGDESNGLCVDLLEIGARLERTQTRGR